MIFRNKSSWLWLLFIGTWVAFYFSLPRDIFVKPRSTALFASDSSLLSAVIAADGQWRFPAIHSVPYKFEKALLCFEDKHFYDHSGVYLPSACRAVMQNITNRKVVSGASTITMQVARLSRNNPKRTLADKLWEVVLAWRLEWKYSKKEILKLYASNAPYGGNVVGIEAAAWRYFGRRPNDLSWAEAATLAVLPNAPSLIYPGKNQIKLLEKRNKLLKKLLIQKVIDLETFELGCTEPLPQKPFPLPQNAYHLLTTSVKYFGKENIFYSTIDKHLQQEVTAICKQHIGQLSANKVHNCAVLIIDIKSNKVLAYVGNSTDPQNKHGNMVDVIQAPRSTGSILKPILYAAMLKDGSLLPNSLVADIPIQFDGFAPQNYSNTFDGAVPASRALSRSLNIPAVLMLKDYGYQRFYQLLKKIGFSHLTRPADGYGLSLILGGAEASLWDISNAYAGLSRVLTTYQQENGTYRKDNYLKAACIQNDLNKKEERECEKYPLLDAGSAWCTFNALLEVNRPESETGWEAYSGEKNIAWKTGTSFGNRDAWAVGTTPDYVVGVWVGNADGQGRPELTGINSAAPLLFDVFDLLPSGDWFGKPYDDLKKIAVCKQSGMRSTRYCDQQDSIWVSEAGLQTPPCKYHQLIQLNTSGTERVNSTCAEVAEMTDRNWFVLPPVQEYFYKLRHPEYALLPPFAEGCIFQDESPIGLIYPKGDSKIFIPKNHQGQYERTVLEATHTDSEAILYWHLNGTFLGETKTIHHFEVKPSPGKYKLTITDSRGNHLEKQIEFLEK